MRKYYLHPRGKGILYAVLVDPQTGAKLTARSTGTKDRDEALLIIAEWLKNGLPAGKKQEPRTLGAIAGIEAILKSVKRADINSDDALRIVQALRDRGLIDIPAVKSGKGSVLFTKFLETFWDYDKSPYVREKLAHGHRIGKQHCYQSLKSFCCHWSPSFQGRTLGSITRYDLKNFSIALSEKGLASATVNKVMAIGTTGLAWAYREGMIPVDPTEGLIGFSGGAKKRGVLTPLEAQALFVHQWKDERAYVGNLLACTTGMRLGEVLAVKREDIEDNVLNVNHAWSRRDELKCPKNGETRRVPLLPEVRDALLALADKNPHGADRFIFYGAYEDKPAAPRVLLEGLQDAFDDVNKKYLEAAEKAALEKPEIQIDWKGRNIGFHSWRHYFAARMTDKMDADQVSRVTGHKTKAIFEEYANHIENENIENARTVGAEVFENILQFKKGA